MMNGQSNEPNVEPADQAERGESGLGRDDEPVTTGTLFLTMIILMVIAAIWAIVYVFLLNR